MPGVPKTDSRFRIPPLPDNLGDDWRMERGRNALLSDNDVREMQGRVDRLFSSVGERPRKRQRESDRQTSVAMIRKIRKGQEAREEASQPAWKRWPKKFGNAICFPFVIAYQLICVLAGTARGRGRVYEQAMLEIDKVLLIAVALILMMQAATAAPLLPNSYQPPQQSKYMSQHFSVYDCEDKHTQFKSLDLTATESCPDPELDYEDAYSSRVMVLQSDAKSLVTVYTCQVYFSKTVSRCGVTHTDYGSERVAIQERILVSPEQCREWAKHKVFNTNAQYLGGKSQLIRLTEGEWSHLDYYSHGHRDGDGNCKWDTWTWNEEEYTKSYEKTSIKARLRKLVGVVNAETGTMTVANGVRVNYKDGTIRDGAEGTMVWNTETKNCSEGISLLYDGVVKIHKLNDRIRKTKADPMAGTIVVMENVKDKQTGAFIIKAQKASCLPKCHITHIPGILVCLNPHRIKDLFTYKPGERRSIKTLMAAVTHTRISGSFDTGNKFGQIQQQLCDVSLDGQLHQLSDIAGNSNAYALRKLVVPGVASRGRKYVPGGAAGYVASCPEKNATLFAYPNCTLQIPIVLQHQIRPNVTQTTVYFADPITMVVQRLPTVVPCSLTMPVKWLIQGTWFCSSPAITKCDAPIKVGTDLDMVGLGPTESDFNPLGGILYSEEQQTENEAFQRSIEYREPIVQDIINNMARGATMDATGKLHFGVPFNDEQMNMISNSVGGRILFLFDWFGSYYTIIVGALFLGAIVKLLLGVGLRVYFMYRKKGFGIWLFTALWHTAFLVIGMPWKIAKGVYDGAVDEVDKVKDEPTQEPGSYEHLAQRLKKVVAIQEHQEGLLYKRDQKIESLMRVFAQSDHKLADYAKTLLSDKEIEMQEITPTAPTANKGSDKDV